MNKTLKKFISILLVMVVLSGVAPLNGFLGLKLPDWLNIQWLSIQAEAVTFTGSCGDNLTYTYYRDRQELVISGTGEMTEDPDTLEYPWSKHHSEIYSVTISDGVTYVGKNAFADFDSMEILNIGSDVSFVDEGAFSNCESLVKVNYTGGLSHWCVINFADSESNPLFYADGLYTKEGMIYGNLVIPKTVTNIGSYVFFGYDRISGVTIHENVVSIGKCAFSNCWNIAEITVDYANSDYSNDEYGALFNKDKTELMQYPLANTATSYSIPEGVTIIGDYAFSTCRNLTGVVIPDGVTNIGKHAFSYTDLFSVTIPDSVTVIGDSAFYACVNLINIIVPDSVKTIGNCAFYHCYRLTDANQ